MSIHDKLSQIQGNFLKHFKKKEVKEVENETGNQVKVTVIMSSPDKEQKGACSPREKITRTLSRKLSIRKSSIEKQDQNKGNEKEGLTRQDSVRNNDLSSDMKIHLPCNGMFFAELPLFKFLNKQQKEILIHIEGLKLEIYVAREAEERTGGLDRQMSREGRAEGKGLGKGAGLKKNTKENSGETGVQRERSIHDEDLELHGHIILPMYIETETLEFCIDEDQSFQIQANIKGAISTPPLGIRENNSPREGRKLSLTQRLVSGSPLLRQVAKRQVSSPGRFQFSPFNSPLLSRFSGRPSSTSSLNINSCPSSPFLFARRLNGSTTLKGVFRPWESLKRDGSKKKASANSCRWDLELPRPGGKLGTFGPKRVTPTSPLCYSSSNESSPSPFDSGLVFVFPGKRERSQTMSSNSGNSIKQRKTGEIRGPLIRGHARATSFRDRLNTN